MAAESRTQWLLYAIASGGCAALNGAFAKLVTTDLTSRWATTLARISGITQSELIVDLLARGFFLLLNIAFNSVMWGLFTRALQLGSSTVRVSIINTSANFIITAALGSLVFNETLPGLWWLGASMLIAGSVIIGSRDEQEPDIINRPENSIISPDNSAGETKLDKESVSVSGSNIGASEIKLRGRKGAQTTARE